MGNSQPDDPGVKSAPKLTTNALNALAVMFGQEKGSFKSIFDAQPFFNQLAESQNQFAVSQQQGMSEATASWLKSDQGLLGTIYKEGLQGPGLSAAENEYFSQQFAQEQAARGVYGSPISAAQSGALLGMYGIQRQQQRQDRALQILSGLTPGVAPQYNVPGNFGSQQSAALGAYGAYQGYYNSQLAAQGQAYQGLGQAAGMAAGMFAACWVAEVLYGVDDPRTHAARLYATFADTPFTRLYRKHGKKWAKWLSRNVWAKALVQPIWDSMARKGEVIARARLALRQGG